jgi:tRNA nucleotidyltransferase (CCA-adding enzyme)
MVVRRGAYPQVEPRAEGLMTTALLVAPAGLAIAEVARLARRRDARLVLARQGTGWGGASPAVLEQALALGLGEAPLAAVLWAAPALVPTTPEVTVRRALGPGTPFASVVKDGQPVGAVFRDADAPRALPRSAAAALDRLDPATVRRLRDAAGIAAALGWPAAAVGGFVRDLLLGRPPAAPRDLDLVVEGDGRAIARRLGRLTGGRVREHEAFLAASVTLPDGGTIDVATARRECYARPGALPRVEPAPLADELVRRDFSVNALAIRLDGPAWGEVLDPTGGLADLEARRIRVLHPLSFVEDPTRIFRAARFAARLGFRVEPTTRRLLRAAAGLAVYEALSGERLRAELEAISAEPDPAAVLALLGRLGAFRLIHPAYRFGPAPRRLLGRVGARGGAADLAPESRVGLHLLALGARLTPADEAAWLTRWGAPAPMRAAIARARREAPAIARGLAAARGPAEAYAALRAVPELTAAWAGVLTPHLRVRRHVDAHLGPWRRLPPLLTGDDLAALGLVPGPRFGRLLDDLRRAQVAGRVRSREAALAWVRRVTAEPGGQPDVRSDNGERPEPKGG